MNFSLWKKCREKILKWKKTDWLILILLGVLCMILAIPTNDRNRQTEEAVQEENIQTEGIRTEKAQAETIRQEQEYRAYLEEELNGILSHMDGVGAAEVMITLENTGEMQLDKNYKESEKSQSRETVIYDMGEKESPYVVDAMMPRVAGVVVVAQGGDNPQTASEIFQVVQSLFDLEAHKITIVKMSALEDVN